MKITSRTFALCLLLIAPGWAIVFPQVGGDKRRPTRKCVTSRPKRSVPKRAQAGRKEEAAEKRPVGVVKNGIGMEFVYVPAGSFLMGSPSSEIGWETDERPLHQVTIREGFYMGRYEVTQAQWRAVMRRNPSSFRNCRRCPVDSVSWSDAQRFIRRLNARGDGFTYRLPTEAEWEYACRAGTTTPFAFGSSLSWAQANFDGTFPYGGAAKGAHRMKTMPVGSFRPNAWGVYDMHGNVWEWCEDWHHYNYDGAPADGRAWLSGGLQKFRVLRGGSWKDRAYYLRSGERGGDASGSRVYYGFRVVAVPRT